MKNKYIIFFCYILLPISVFGQRIMDLPQLNKLPVFSIHCIFQDKEGYIWYGTSDGLCRDDGYNIQVFRSDMHTLNVMQSNVIWTIAEDMANRLWLGTYEGAYILDKTSFNIYQLDPTSIKGQKIIMIKSTSEGNMWVSTANGLYQFDSEGKLIHSYKIDKGNGKVEYLYEDNDHDIWICVGSAGLCKLNKETKTIESFSEGEAIRENFILQDRNNNYWVGTWGNGIKRFAPYATKRARYVSQPETQVNDGRIISIVQDEVHGYIWATTYSNILAFRISERGMLEQVETSGFIPQNNKMLVGITKDKDKNLWVPAYDRKSFIINLKDNGIKEYNISAMQDRFKGNPSIVTLCKDEGNVFWILQDRWGLCLYNSDLDKLVHYSDCPGTKNQHLWGIPYLIKSNKKGKIWAMSGGTKVYGIKQTNMSMDMEETIDLKNITDKSGTLKTIYEDQSGNLWMGTTEGLFVYEFNAKNVEKFNKIAGVVTGITETNDGALWICINNKGVYKIGKDDKYIFFPINKKLSCIDSTSDGKLWIGTYVGEILLLDPLGQQALTDYSEICNMNGDVFETIIVDDFNHVWILTNQRVKEFNPKNNVYHNYSISEKSFLLNRFLPRSAYKTSDNTILFGGILGFISINSSNRLESIPKPVKTFITNIKIGEKSLLFDGHTSFSHNTIVEIKPDSYNIEINFSTLDYLNTSQIRYAYKLSGVDRDWNYIADGKNTAFYNQLGKGKYVFQVKATDENGLWSNNITELVIEKLPAWYETWWAYSCYFLIICVVAWIILYLYLQKVKQKNNKEMAEQLTQIKLRYFTNISHDLMTPLTIFSCIIDEMKLAGKEDLGRINQLQSNIVRLKRLLQQILDFRKVESGNMKLKVTHLNISTFIEDICKKDFAPLVKSKQIKFSLSIEPDQIEGYCDSDKLDKIIFNLLSNAFKYTADGKEIYVEVKSFQQNDHTYLQIIIRDQGRGIEKKEQKRIFTRFYNDKLSEAGLSNGIGLSLVKELVELHHGSIELESEIKIGSTFTVVIPIDKYSYSDEERTNHPISTGNNISVLEIDTNKEIILDNELISKYNLLLVEDNEELLSLMQNILSRQYNVFTAQNGNLALKVINQHAIDIVISDIMMPEMDGLELCQVIKADINTSHIIVILLTAKNTTEDRIESYLVNADAYIQKPFEINVLRARLENLLRLRKQNQKAFKANSSIEISELEISSIDEQLIAKALQVVEANLGDFNFDVSILAEQLSITRATLSRKIKAITGQTPLEFIRNIKMKHACRMLENANVRVSEVITALGYNDHKYFTNTFKETFGITPREFQKKNKTSGS